MTGCRIARVRLKSNGAVIEALPTKEVPIFYSTIRNAARLIGPDTHAVAFFVMSKDRTVQSGITYDSGFALSDLIGGCERMKQQLQKDIWGREDG